jgi:hypothetical protein
VRLGKLRPRRRAASALLLSTLCLLVFSCGSKPPSVATVEWRLESRPNPAGGDYESLSAFASIVADEGVDNISELWVVNDANALSWKLTSADWTKPNSGSDNWLGGSALAQADFGPLPRGEYRMIAIDAAGQRAEASFQISGAFPDRAPPRASYEEGKLSVVSSWPETLVLAFDAVGSLIASPAAPKGGASLAGAFGADIAGRAASVGAYGYDPSLKMGSFGKRMTTR